MVLSNQTYEQPKSYLHPGMAFFDLFVQGQRVSLIPDHLTSMVDRRIPNNRQYLTVNVFDASWDTLSNILLPHRGDIKFEYGWIDGPTGGRRSGRLVRYREDITYQGVSIEFNLVEVAETKSKLVKQRSFRDGRPTVSNGQSESNLSKVSDVATFLAEEMGLEADVEETVGLYPLMQVNKTNLNFLRNELRKNAKSAASGRTDYDVGITGNILYFKTPDYRRIVRNYDYARGQDSTMSHFSADIAANLQFLGDGSGVRVAGHDPIEKKALTADVTFRDRKRVAQASRVSPGAEEPSRLFVSSLDSLAQVEDYARWKFEQMSRKVVTARATVMGDPYLRPLHIIGIRILTDVGKVHYLSGNYKLTDVKHVISNNGEFFSELTMVSDGHRNDAEPNPGIRVPSQNVQPPPTEETGSVKFSFELPERGF